jgi:hypothetical protein
MKKENVFIVLSITNHLKPGSHPGRNKHAKTEWEVSERVEFVNALKPKHYTMSIAIGDYINRKMITGTRHGLTDYDVFENYVRQKYEKQMTELDAAYQTERVPVTEAATEEPKLVDQFGNTRPKTVFDAV